MTRHHAIVRRWRGETAWACHGLNCLDAEAIRIGIDCALSARVHFQDRIHGNSQRLRSTISSEGERDWITVFVDRWQRESTREGAHVWWRRSR